MEAHLPLLDPIWLIFLLASTVHTCASGPVERAHTTESQHQCCGNLLINTIYYSLKSKS